MTTIPEGGVMNCIGCGCSELRACDAGGVGCHWVSHNPPVCSECDGLFDEGEFSGPAFENVIGANENAPLACLRRLGRNNDHTGLVVEPARQLLQRVEAAHKCRLLPTGAMLGTAVIGEPKLSPDIFGIPVADSDRGKFNYGWPLTDIQPFEPPIPMRGAQGFWTVPERIAT